MRRLLGLSMLMASTALAAQLPCSVHPAKGTSASGLPALTTVTLDDARTTALASIEAPPASKVTEGELEVEDGCLVYSFDIRVPGRSGIEEVMVDPVSGKVLSHSRESAQQEVQEQAKDRAVQHKRN